MKECTVFCRSFRCAKHALKIIKEPSGKKKFLCTLEGDECIGYLCKYAQCAEGKLADDGRCLKPDKPIRKNASKNDQLRKVMKYLDDDFDTNYIDDKLYKKLRRKM